MADEKVIPTHEEIRATFTRVREQIAGMDLCLDATIADYPIGRRERGKCRLQVERAKGKGYRTVRTTTNKFGRWCKPHKSTYTDSCTVVIRNYDTEHEHVWLHIGEGGVFIRFANEAGVALVKAPHYCKPQREPRTVTWTTRKLAIDGSGVHGHGAVERSTDVLPADPPELCDAYDAWLAEYVELRKLVLAVWDRCCVQV